MTNFIFIDGSYYIFYRFFALQNWWKMAHKDEPLGDPSLNIEFVNKFKNVFKNKIKELVKKLKLDNPVIIVGKDCPRNQIWRMNIFPDYKKNRICDENPENPEANPSAFFKLVYQEELFQECGATVIAHDKLEADDCIALTVKHTHKIAPESYIYIIANDHDYFQLLETNIHLYDLKYKQVNTEKNSYSNAKKDLFVKCVAGDKSDNIPSVLNRCGKKTASKYFDDKNAFIAKCKKENVLDIFERNVQIIDFNHIPTELVESFNTNVLLISK